MKINLATEITEWSDHVLNWLLNEESISLSTRVTIEAEINNRLHPEPSIELTKENLSALFNCNSPNRKQVSMLGIKYPLRNGWMKQLIGTTIPHSLYASLLSCKGKRPVGVSTKEWKSPNL